MTYNACFIDLSTCWLNKTKIICKLLLIYNYIIEIVILRPWLIIGIAKINIKILSSETKSTLEVPDVCSLGMRNWMQLGTDVCLDNSYVLQIKQFLDRFRQVCNKSRRWLCALEIVIQTLCSIKKPLSCWQCQAGWGAPCGWEYSDKGTFPSPGGTIQ